METQTGNLPDNPIERKETVAGQENVRVFYNEKDTEYKEPIGVRDPENLKGEELEKWRNDVNNEINMKRSASTKYDEAAEVRRQIENERSDLQEEKKAFYRERDANPTKKTQPEPIITEEPEFNAILAKITGKQFITDEESSNVRDDNPLAYDKAMKQYAKSLSDANYKKLANLKNIDMQSAANLMVLKNAITIEGMNADKVESWAKGRGMSFDRNAFDFYKATHKDERSITEKLNQNIQPGKDFVFIKSDVKSSFSTKTLADEFDTKEELQAYVDKELTKENPDPRVLELMKD